MDVNVNCPQNKVERVAPVGATSTKHMRFMRPSTTAA